MKRLLVLSLCALLLAGLFPVSASAQIDKDAIAAAREPCADVVKSLNCQEKGRELMEQFLPTIINYLANKLQTINGRETDALALKELYAGLTEEQRDNLADYVMECYCAAFPHRVGIEAMFEFFGAAVYEWYITIGRDLAAHAAADAINALNDALDESLENLNREFEATVAANR